jgi:rhodanese-related sulfurtransferase
VSLPDDPTADVTPAATAELLAAGTVTVIDVRDGDEWSAGHIRGAIHAPLNSLDPAAVDASKPIIAVCRSGNRSRKATEMLRAGGLTVHNMTGGMHAWAQTGLPVQAADRTPGSVR